MTNLSEEGSGKLIWIMCINWSRIAAKSWVQASECLGVVTGVKLARLGFTSWTKLWDCITANCIKAGAAVARSFPRMKCELDNGFPIGLSKVIFVDWDAFERSAFSRLQGTPFTTSFTLA